MNILKHSMSKATKCIDIRDRCNDCSLLNRVAQKFWVSLLQQASQNMMDLIPENQKKNCIQSFFKKAGIFENYEFYV